MLTAGRVLTSVDRDPLLDSAWSKWARAIHHAQALQSEIDQGQPGGEPLLSVRTEYQPHRHGFAVYAIDIRGVPASWGLLVGDIAFNYRCALDHLAWALVSRGRTPPSVLTQQQQKAVYFPIAKSRRQFNDSLATKLPGAKRSDTAKVRATQPYHNGRKLSRHNFVILAELNNRDKHRSIEPVWDHTVTLGLHITEQHDVANPRVRRLIRGPRELRVGAELALIRVRRTGPDPRVELAFERAGVPSIAPGVSLTDWVTQTGAQIGILLGAFSQAPEEVERATLAWFET
jgi:hypothetical protein